MVQRVFEGKGDFKKIKFYDKNNDGTLDQDECREFITDMLIEMNEEPYFTDKEFEAMFK